MIEPSPLCRTLAAEIALDAGEYLYREGDIAEYGYIIDSGEILLFNSIEGAINNIERRGPGSIVGELSILTGKPRAVSVKALTPCRVFRVSSEQILHRFNKLDPILKACVETSIDFAKRYQTPTNGKTPLIPANLADADAVIERFKLERDILNGLGTDQFSLAYQPIVRIEDGSILGFEALMRWQHPTIGNVPPGVFIEVAEVMGSICSLTNFALMEASAALRRLHNLNPDRTDLFASINVSADDIDRADFVDFLDHVLDLHDLQPHNLKLEITETALVPNSRTAAKTLEQLERFGCGLSIDDFGTGYSNLAYLKKLPLTAIKIDRAFAGDACKNAVSRSIAKMIIGLGRELGVDVIAEGLETQDDVDALLHLGCDLAQGYHFCRPVTEDAFASMITSQTDAPRKIA